MPSASSLHAYTSFRCGGQKPHRRRPCVAYAPRRQGSCRTRPVTVAPPLHYVSFCRVGARRSQTGGDPAAPGWVPAALSSLTRGRASALPLRGIAQRFQSRRSLQPGPHGPALAESRVLAPFAGAADQPASTATSSDAAGLLHPAPAGLRGTVTDRYVGAALLKSAPPELQSLTLPAPRWSSLRPRTGR